MVEEASRPLFCEVFQGQSLRGSIRSTPWPRAAVSVTVADRRAGDGQASCRRPTLAPLSDSSRKSWAKATISRLMLDGALQSGYPRNVPNRPGGSRTAVVCGG